MSFVITKAAIEHAEGFANVMVRSWHAAYTGIIPQHYLDDMVTMEKNLPRFRRILANSTFANYVSILDGQVIGVLTIGRLREEHAGDQDGEIISIYLLPEYFNQGYGKMMMDFAIAKLCALGLSNIYIWVLKGNSRARRFYEKCGFVLTAKEKTIQIGIPLLEVCYWKQFSGE
ncbi:MAG: GNAT family N-acetyltransferase [Firmicutes bacterium]|nr:GNAT family N-acetyltransferase [Bacillota bacterium]